MPRHSRSGLAVALLVLLIGSTRLAATYLMPATETVPVERLIRNLEANAAKAPKNAQIRFNLARVHAMVFAKKMAGDDPVEVMKGRESQPWFGIGSQLDPPASFPVVETSNARRLREAKEHLELAIDLYRQGIVLDPTDVRAKLGYAWCIDQSGDRAKAVTAYRQVIAEAWVDSSRPAEVTPADRNGEATIYFGGWSPYLSAEAARYLIPLLDREKDRDEIATLEARMRMVDFVGFRGETPIAIPLSDSARPETFLDPDARVPFDADGRAVPRRWTWITPEAAWLVHAPSKTHPVTSALQLFGSVTFWLFWDNGYQALAALDDNGDGVLKDAELEGLGLWHDTNRDGVADESEVKLLAEWNIVSLDCAHEDARGRRDYVAYSPRGVTFKDGHTRPTWDVLLYPQPARGAIYDQDSE